MSDREGLWLLIGAGLAFALACGALLPELTWQIHAARRLRRMKRRGGSL
jgi:Flp pilus assembly protein TadB